MKFRRFNTHEEKQEIVSHIGPWDPEKAAVFTPRMNRDVFYPATDPRFVSADEADFMHPQDHVWGVSHNGEAKAYPAFVTDLYHQLNDTIGGEPVVLNA